MKVPTLILKENKPTGMAATEQSPKHWNPNTTHWSQWEQREGDYVKHCYLPEKAFNQVNKGSIAVCFFLNLYEYLQTYSGPVTIASIAQRGFVILKINLVLSMLRSFLVMSSEYKWQHFKKSHLSGLDFKTCLKNNTTVFLLKMREYFLAS